MSSFITRRRALLAAPALILPRRLRAQAGQVALAVQPPAAPPPPSHYLLMGSGGGGSVTCGITSDYTIFNQGDLQIELNQASNTSSGGTWLMSYWGGGWAWALNPSGTLLFIYFSGGNYFINSSAAISTPTGVFVWLRCLFNLTTGSLGGCPANTVLFYQSTDNRATWQQVGTSFTVLTTSWTVIFSSISIGQIDATGWEAAKIQRAFFSSQVASAGTLFDIDFSIYSTGTTSFSTAGRTWTVNSPAVIT